jgi:hypothetical protein
MSQPILTLMVPYSPYMQTSPVPVGSSYLNGKNQQQPNNAYEIAGLAHVSVAYWSDPDIQTISTGGWFPSYWQNS